jgi:hypothetical protein
MGVARTSDTSVDSYFIRQYIPEDNSELHTRRRENFKSHMSTLVCCVWNLVVLYVVTDGSEESSSSYKKYAPSARPQGIRIQKITVKIQEL